MSMLKRMWMAAVLAWMVPLWGTWAAPAASGFQGSPAAPLTQADAEAWLDGFLPKALREGDIAGGVVTVVKDGHILVKKGYGFADVKRAIPVDPDRTLFRPGSITKTFTWTAVMQLVEQGRLDLDADVNTYLDFKIPSMQGRADGPPITLRHLMTHTAGFEEMLKRLLVADTHETLSEYVKDWTPTRIFVPGQVPAYSNYGTALAGYIVERVSGEPYSQYVNGHILGPLGMTMSTASQPLPARLRPLMSQGYRLGSGPAEYFELVPGAPAGVLSVTGADMGRYMLAHLQNGTYDGRSILRPETAVQLHAVQPKIFPAINGATLGFYETNRNGHRVIAHNGGSQWFHSDMHLFVDDGVGLFISLNSEGRDGAPRALHDRLFTGFTDRYFPATRPLPQPAVDARDSRIRANLVDGYWEVASRSESNFLSTLRLLGALRISAQGDGALRWALPGNPETTWHEISPFVWRQEGGQDRMQVMTEHGRPVLMGLDKGVVMGFQPVPGWRSPGWLLPAIAAGLLVLLARGLASFTRWSGGNAPSARVARGLGVAAALVLIAFPCLVTYLFGDAQRTMPSSHPLILGLEGLALLTLPAAALASLVDLVRGWPSRPGLLAKAASVAAALSCALLLWVGLLFHLMKLTTHY